MAVSKAEKTTELNELVVAFKEADTAVLVDYKGITVPQVTELRRQVRAAGGRYRVVKNTLARRAAAGTSLSALTEHFSGPTAVVFTEKDPVAMAKALTTFAKGAPTLSIKAAIVQGQAVTRRRRRRSREPAGQGRALRQAALRAPGADAAAGHRVVRRAARSDERAGGGGERRRASRSEVKFEVRIASASSTSNFEILIG